MEEEDKRRYEGIIERLKSENQNLHRRIINMKAEPSHQGLIIGMILVFCFVLLDFFIPKSQVLFG